MSLGNPLIYLKVTDTYHRLLENTDSFCLLSKREEKRNKHTLELLYSQELNIYSLFLLSCLNIYLYKYCLGKLPTYTTFLATILLYYLKMSLMWHCQGYLAMSMSQIRFPLWTVCFPGFRKGNHFSLLHFLVRFI